MHFLTLLTLSPLLFLTTATALPNKRNDKTDPMSLTWWSNGCGTDSLDQQTWTFTTTGDSGSPPGTCVTVPEYNWQSVQITQDSGASYSVDLFSGEGCNNFIKTVTENGCYTQPEGEIFLSARVNLAQA